MAIVRPHSVLPDANIWCSATLHTWFGLIASETIGSWSFHWTEDILAEAVYHRRKRFPRASSQQIEALRDRLMASMGENRISRFPIDESVTYPDEYDAHVHSAAIHEGIAIIVTNDRAGFAGLYPDPDDCPYEVHSADDFLTLVADSAPQVVDAAITSQLAYWTGKGHSFSLPEKLRRADAPHFAEYVRYRLQTIPPASSVLIPAVATTWFGVVSANSTSSAPRRPQRHLPPRRCGAIRRGYQQPCAPAAAGKLLTPVNLEP